MLDCVGAGGMGVVYSAYDYGLDRRVALKLVRDHGGTTARARLMREAQVLAKLSHPNVVAAYDVGEHEGEVYIAMELVEGTSLRDWLAVEPRDWPTILEAFRHVGAGLAAAHAAGIVHRDVKPDNVLIDREGAVRVSDFGLAMITRDVDPQDDDGPAAIAGTVTKTGAAIGTPAYMSPEQHAARREIDARSDQFSFCIALHEALFGVRPFAGTWSRELCAAIEARRFSSPVAGRDVPGWIRSVLVRGLALDPGARFPSMPALLAALARDPRARRRRWAAVGAAAVASAAVALGVARLAGGEAAPVCQIDTARFAGVWDATRRAAMQAAFVRSGAPDAADRWAHVERGLDDWTAGWQRMRTDACEATRVRGEQSLALLDLRMTCLDDRAVELRALTDVLMSADRTKVDRAPNAVRELSDLETCTASAALRAHDHRATDAAADQRRTRMANVQALRTTGDWSRAVELARPLAHDADAAHDPRIEGEALWVIGKVLTYKGDFAGAEDALFGSIAAAETANADELVATSWVQLMWLVGSETRRYTEAHQIARITQGAIERLGNAAHLQGEYEDHLGVLLLREGKYDEAAPHLERGLALRRSTARPESTNVAASLQHLGNMYRLRGGHDKALELFHQARAEVEAALGATYPAALEYAGDEAIALHDLGRDREAVVLYEQVIAAKLRNDPSDRSNLGKLYNNLSESQRDLGRIHGARASLEHAVAMYEQSNGPSDDRVVSARQSLAEVLDLEHEYALALEQLDKVRAARETADAKDETDLADALAAIGMVQRHAGHPDAAIAPLERAMTIYARHPASASDAANDQLELARALVAAGRDRTRAQALASAARVKFAADGNAAKLKELDEWRASLGGAERRAAR